MKTSALSFLLKQAGSTRQTPAGVREDTDLILPPHLRSMPNTGRLVPYTFWNGKNGYIDSNTLKAFEQAGIGRESYDPTKPEGQRWTLGWKQQQQAAGGAGATGAAVGGAGATGAAVGGAGVAAPTPPPPEAGAPAVTTPPVTAGTASPISAGAGAQAAAPAASMAAAGPKPTTDPEAAL